ncbi:MAG: murein biosynthesis integral membrane protein MurJ [bacterium]|nr:murein biosynthesis integral membrane protein MurJ [bacterium]
MLNKILNRETNSISAGGIIFAFSALLSRILGLVRDRLLANQFGAGEVLDVYYASFQIPDFFYNLFILGTLSVAFIPVFTSYIQNGERQKFSEEALSFANSILNLVFLLMGAGCFILIILAPYILHFIVPGFSGGKYAETVMMTRVMLFSPFFFSISSVFGSMLTSFRRFIVICIAPILYNAGIIFGVIFLAPIFGVKGLALGVISGAFLHMLVQFFATKNLGYRYQKIIDVNSAGIKKFTRLFIPRIISMDLSQVSILIANIFGSVLTGGSIAVFNLANNIQSLPLGLFGISLASAAFPHLSEAASDKNFIKFREHLSKTSWKIIFFILSASVILFIFSQPIVRLLLSTGKFSAKEAALTSAVLSCFCLSLFPQGLIPLFLRAFYSLQDTVTPLIINIVSIIIDVLASFLFVRLLGSSGWMNKFIYDYFGIFRTEDIRVLGLALGFSLASWINLLLIYSLIYLRLKKIDA